jgi:ribosomal protein L16/L10AE
MKKKTINKNMMKKTHKVYKKPFYVSTFGTNNYCLVSLSFCVVSERQLESARKFISRIFDKRSHKLRRNNFTHSIFKKSSKSRMGKGIGKFYKRYGYIRPGTVIFEFSDNMIPFIESKIKFSTISSKLPFRCRILHKEKLIYYDNYGRQKET